MPRLVCPSWRWMTINGTPSRAISTACAWRSWCGANRRCTLASRARFAAPSGRAGRPRPPARRAVADAEQRADRQLNPRVEPRGELPPRPVVHPDLAATAALAAPHEQRAATRVKVGLGERECLVDPQAGAPEHDDQ